jgi:LmbE family N-acetylglucosaminyl deacetylase
MRSASRCITFISPHLDDAVLSCGQLMSRHSGSILLTVFAGTPNDARVLTDWDRASGFQSAAEAMVSRRMEDCAAAACLNVDVLHLRFVDAQYGEPVSLDAVVDELAQAVATGPIVAPVGLFHEDHRFSHRACVELVQRCADGDTDLAFYEDVPYRSMEQGRLVDEALAQLSRSWPIRLASIHDRDAARRKTDAIRCYASQLRAFNIASPSDMPDSQRPERYWVAVGDGSWL